MVRLAAIRVVPAHRVARVGVEAIGVGAVGRRLLQLRNEGREIAGLCSGNDLDRPHRHGSLPCNRMLAKQLQVVQLKITGGSRQQAPRWSLTALQTSSRNDFIPAATGAYVA